MRMNFKNVIATRIANTAKLTFILLCILTSFTSFTLTNYKQTTEVITIETTPEESTLAFADLPEEEQESILYSPNEDFKHVGTREKQDIFCFAGDIILAERPRAAYDKGGIDAVVDEGIRLLFEKSDLSVANLECCITDEAVDKADKEWTFALPTKYVEVIKEAGIKLLTLANNHILDFGADALINTIKVLDENNVFHIGAGENIREASKIYIKEIEGKRYAFIGASAVIPHESWKANEDRAGVANGYDTMTICNRILNLKTKLAVDKVIVYIHWGKELELYSSEMQKMIGRRLVDAGADLVVGTHAHVVQEIEYYNNVPIVYSLGNFVYGGTKRDMIILQATFDYSKNEKGDLKLKVYPGIANYQKAIRYYDEEILKTKIDELNRKNRYCKIDYSGVVNIENIIENDLEPTAKPEIFETTIETSIDETTTISISELASLAISLQTMDSSEMANILETADLKPIETISINPHEIFDIVGTEINVEELESVYESVQENTQESVR